MIEIGKSVRSSQQQRSVVIVVCVVSEFVRVQRVKINKNTLRVTGALASWSTAR